MKTGAHPADAKTQILCLYIRLSLVRNPIKIGLADK